MDKTVFIFKYYSIIFGHTISYLYTNLKKAQGINEVIVCLLALLERSRKKWGAIVNTSD
jgi:hypothetical protein